jgi:hypothetical protein
VHNKRHVRNVSFSPTYDFGATQVVCVELNVNVADRINVLLWINIFIYIYEIRDIGLVKMATSSMLNCLFGTV